MERIFVIFEETDSGIKLMSAWATEEEGRAAVDRAAKRALWYSGVPEEDLNDALASNGYGAYGMMDVVLGADADPLGTGLVLDGVPLQD